MQLNQSLSRVSVGGDTWIIGTAGIIRFITYTIWLSQSDTRMLYECKIWQIVIIFKHRQFLGCLITLFSLLSAKYSNKVITDILKIIINILMIQSCNLHPHLRPLCCHYSKAL